MNVLRPAALPVTAALALLAGTPAHADATSSASSASSTSSASLGSLSTSIGKSSDASSKGGQVAGGEYRVVEVAAAGNRPGTLRLRLQALDETAALREFDLYLPEQALPAGGLAAGESIAVSERAYGLAFAKAGAAQAFFLVLEDGWFRELRTTPVTI